MYRITGGYVALAVEFNDHILIFEPAGQNEARAQAIIAEAKRVIPNKPIRYGVLSHHHFDHTSGIAAVVAEGITIVTHEANKEFFENALSAPRTLAPDSMSKSGKRPVIETVGDKRVFTDGTQTVEIHNIKGLPHADGMLIAYIPSARIVAYADMFNLVAPGQPARAESARRRHAGVRRELGAARARLGEFHLGARTESRSADHAPRHARDARSLSEEVRAGRGAGVTVSVRAARPQCRLARTVAARTETVTPAYAGARRRALWRRGRLLLFRQLDGSRRDRRIRHADQALDLVRRERLEHAEPAIQAAARASRAQ